MNAQINTWKGKNTWKTLQTKEIRRKKEQATYGSDESFENRGNL